jgi:NAD(P)-dependent dehydrogenase (short-subunit alcohol dehydrogenase family)
MTEKKTWMIIRAGRGMGTDFAKAALSAGHHVVATGRDPQAVSEALADADDLLVVKLDITKPEDAHAAVAAAVKRFGRIDVLLNNAANSYLGYFEELTPERVERQLQTNLLGPMNVTRAVLPVLRRQRSGHVIAISSGAGLAGFEFCSPYVASKHGLEGWIDSLRHEVEPLGITTTIVNPGFFRTQQDGRQPGDPAKLAQALVSISSEPPPARRFIGGADTIAVAEQKAADLQEQIFAYRDLSMSLAHQDTTAEVA